jgi:hypothetical protein
MIIYCDDLPKHAKVVSVTPVGSLSAKCDVPAHIAPEFLPCVFLGAGLEVMDQFLN